MPQTWTDFVLLAVLLGGPPTVLLVSLAAAAVRYGERARYRRRRADDCEWYALLTRLATGDAEGPDRPGASERFEMLARRYRHAARRPWRPVEDDPPGP
jgi:hypothetical protein